MHHSFSSSSFLFFSYYLQTEKHTSKTIAKWQLKKKVALLINITIVVSIFSLVIRPKDLMAIVHASRQASSTLIGALEAFQCAINPSGRGN
jgi:hypothetical protein